MFLFFLPVFLSEVSLCSISIDIIGKSGNPRAKSVSGMEIPIYTFATPAVISGDRQNVDLFAHELSHGWSGNLVTNCNWEHL
jgi:hypothetical protein